jgi:alpha-ketoglutarate-dependent taurine dioxygenase
MPCADSYPYFDPNLYLTTPGRLQTDVSTNGLAIVDLGPNLNAEALYDLARGLGRVMLEPTDAVRVQAYQGSVVRVETLGDSADVVTPANPVAPQGMHIDHALTAPPDMQPLRVLLGSVVPPLPDSGGQTTVCDMQAVFDGLSEEEQELLSQSTQRMLEEDEDGELKVVQTSENTLITTYNGRWYISLWDPGPYGEKWDLEIPEDATPEQARAAVEHMHNLLYDPQNTKAVPWKEGRVVILDNHRILHGRTPQPKPSPRAILRAKVLEPLSA